MDRFILTIVCLNIFAATVGNAQNRITSLSLDEAVTLATRENFTLRAAQLDYQATRANEITAGSLPNPAFSYMAEMVRPTAAARSIEANYQATVVQAISEVDTALGAMLNERQKVTALRDTYLPKAQQARDTVDFAYRRGGASLLDFLDAQRTYRETSLEYVRSLGNYWTPLYQLELAVGGSLVK